jgi:glycosyltransferase domain-containing protein
MQHRLDTDMQSSDENAERSVTLIIPTLHSRGALFARVLRYLSAAGFLCPIVVTDHSPPQHLNVIADIVKRHDKLNLKLLQHSPDIHFLERLTLCANAADTPYVHLHADDDFLIRRTLIALIGVMNATPRCAAAMGLNAHLQIASGGLQLLAKSPVEQPVPFLRMIAQLETYSSVLYALRRREEFIATMSFAVTRCPDVQFFQYLESCVAVLAGTIAVIDHLHYVREAHPGKWSSTLVREQSPDHFPYLILSPDFTPRVSAFRAALIEACQARNIAANTKAIDNGLIHLLYRGLGAMGLPEKHAAGKDITQHLSARFSARMSDPNDPTRGDLERIVAVGRG